MTRITTECPDCGRVELGVDDVTLVVSPRQGIAWYLFDCLGCVRQVVKPASTPVVSALARLAIQLRTVPAEVVERGQSGEAEAPLVVDDLLDLILSLRSRHDLAEPPIEAHAPSGLV